MPALNESTLDSSVILYWRQQALYLYQQGKPLAIIAEYLAIDPEWIVLWHQEAAAIAPRKPFRHPHFPGDQMLWPSSIAFGVGLEVV